VVGRASAYMGLFIYFGDAVGPQRRGFSNLKLREVFFCGIDALSIPLRPFVCLRECN
jgi:hypothetical protein